MEVLRSYCMQSFAEFFFYDGISPKIRGYCKVLLDLLSKYC
jgi:hypothetical protein